MTFALYILDLVAVSRLLPCQMRDHMRRLYHQVLEERRRHEMFDYRVGEI